MNQDRDKNTQNQNQNQNKQPQQQQGQGKPEMNERGNPSTTERIQPEPNRTGSQKPEGKTPTGSQQPKL
jgi:hypothetical protein